MTPEVTPNANTNTDNQDSFEDLRRYETHSAVAEQASAFLGQLSTTAGLYATVTGAAWAVVTGNTFGVRNSMLLWLLGLHILLSLGMALGMWGLANNLIQRLNFARWLGNAYWPSIQQYGGPDVAWRGVPKANWKPSTEHCVMSSDVEIFCNWHNNYVNKKIKKARNNCPIWILPRPVKWIGFYLRYRAFTWPSLRFQRLWALLPAVGAAASIVLFVDIRSDGPSKKHLCDGAATLLGRSDLRPNDRLAFEQARYLFDKTGCDVMRIEELRERRLRAPSAGE
jgi:hypothetical protein